MIVIYGPKQIIPHRWPAVYNKSYLHNPLTMFSILQQELTQKQLYFFINEFSIL